MKIGDLAEYVLLALYVIACIALVITWGKL